MLAKATDGRARFVGRVLLDGADVTNQCLAFDAAAGFADCFMDSDAGRPRVGVVRGQLQVLRVRIYGAITVVCRQK